MKREGEFCEDNCLSYSLKWYNKCSCIKSITHRALICASFCRDKSIIKNPLIANDTLETIEALKT